MSDSRLEAAQAYLVLAAADFARAFGDVAEELARIHADRTDEEHRVYVERVHRIAGLIGTLSSELAATVNAYANGDDAR